MFRNQQNVETYFGSLNSNIDLLVIDLQGGEWDLLFLTIKFLSNKNYVKQISISGR